MSATPERPPRNPYRRVTQRSLDDDLIRGDEILDIPPRQSLVGDLLHQDSLAAIYGAPGAGKSLLALDIGLSVATRQPWQGREVIDGPVLYIAAEDPPGIAQRARAWRSRHGELGRSAWLKRAVHLLDPYAVTELCDLVARVAPALVVVDTLARCMSGADENSVKDMGAVVEALDRIRMVLGSCVLAVHHSGKDSARGMRGHTSLLAGLDTVIACTRTHTGITAVVDKQKNAADGQRLHFSLEPEGDSVVIVESVKGTDSAPAWRPTWYMEQVSKFLEGVDEANVNTIRKAKLGKSERVDEALTCLIAEGFVSISRVGNASQHRSLKPFRQSAEDAS